MLHMPSHKPNLLHAYSCSSWLEELLRGASVVYVQIHLCEEPGDILVFLTGEEEIEDACRKIRDEGGNYEETHGELVVYPLYSSLPPLQQQKIFLVSCSTALLLALGVMTRAR